MITEINKLDPRVIHQLRMWAKQGASVSQLLKATIQLFAPDEPHKILLAKYMMAAFFLSFSQVNAICGWDANGHGEMPDERLNEFISGEIMQTKTQWENLSE